MGQIILNYPSHIRLELTQGCNRSCYSCPVSQNQKFMNMEIFEIILKQFNQKIKRMELSMHGEPLLNPNVERYIKMLRKQLPKAQISIITNTEIFYKKPSLMVALFLAGLNFLQADVYSEKIKKNFIDLIHILKPKLNSNNIKAQYFIKGGINIWKYNYKDRYILLSDESKGINIIEKHAMRKVHTWAGNLPLKRWKHYELFLDQFPIKKKCTEPMKCAPIDIYGNVSLCCADYAKSYIYGNLKEESLENIWNGKQIQKVRCALSQGWRDIIPACHFCNKPSFRIGLWPYKERSWTKKYLKKFFTENSFISKNLKELFIKYNENILKERLNNDCKL